MTNKIVTVIVDNDDIYFIIGDKKTSVLKMLTKLDEKVNRFALGSWIALGLGIILLFPAAIFQLGLSEIKEQSETIEKQSETIEKQSETIHNLSDRLLILETQLNNK